MLCYCISSNFGLSVNTIRNSILEKKKRHKWLWGSCR